MEDEIINSYEGIAPRIFSNYYCNDDPLIKKVFKCFFKDYEIHSAPKDIFVIADLSTDNSLKLEIYPLNSESLCYRKLKFPGKCFTLSVSEKYYGVSIGDTR